MPRSILNLVLEKELNCTAGSSDIPKDLIDCNAVESIEGDTNHTEAKASPISSLGVFNESQLRDVTEVLEVQSLSLIRPLSVNKEDDGELCRTIIDSSHVDGTSSRTNNSLSLKRDVSKEAQQSNIESDHQEEIRSASGLGESCSNSCYSTSSSSLPGNGSDLRENDPEANLQPSSSTSPSSPSLATVTVSTCPSCGSENVDPSIKSHRRYSTESYNQNAQQTNKWKGYSRPEISRKSSHRSSPYKIKSNCNSSFKHSRHHSHHHHGHNYGNHRLMNRPPKKHSLSSELDMIRKKSKTKRDRYCSKSSSRLNSNDLRDTGRCHICKHDEDNRLSGLYPSIGVTGLGRSSKADCPYSLAYDDDHLMSHLCDIDSWHRRRKRETLKKKERAIIAILSIVAVLIFIAMSYFGTILFLRITTMPVS